MYALPFPCFLSCHINAFHRAAATRVRHGAVGRLNCGAGDLMYNDDVTRVPCGEDELWEVLEEQFEFVCDVLRDLKVETREDALRNVHHQKMPDGRYGRTHPA